MWFVVAAVQVLYDEEEAPDGFKKLRKDITKGSAVYLAIRRGAEGAASGAAAAAAGDDAAGAGDTAGNERAIAGLVITVDNEKPGTEADSSLMCVALGLLGLG